MGVHLLQHSNKSELIFLLYDIYQTTCSIKRPGLNFPPKVSIKRTGLSQVLRVAVNENQGNLDFFETVSIKRPVLSQF